MHIAVDHEWRLKHWDVLKTINRLLLLSLGFESFFNTILDLRVSVRVGLLNYTLQGHVDIKFASGYVLTTHDTLALLLEVAGEAVLAKCVAAWRRDR